jgi:ribonuclease P protein component
MILRFVRLKDQKGKKMPARIGISVSKKVGGAVVRNRVKRRIAAGLYEYVHWLPNGFHLIFIAKNKSRSADFGQIQRAVLQLLKRVKLLTDDPEQF